MNEPSDADESYSRSELYMAFRQFVAQEVAEYREAKTEISEYEEPGYGREYLAVTTVGEGPFAMIHSLHVEDLEGDRFTLQQIREAVNIVTVNSLEQARLVIKGIRSLLVPSG